MTHDHDPLRLLVAGGGVAALELLAALRHRAHGRLDRLVVVPDTVFRDRPLELGEPFGLGPARRFSLETLCASLDARFRRDAVVAVDAHRHVAHTATGDTLRYDVLVLATGAAALPAFTDGVTFDRARAPEDFDEVLAAATDGFADHVAIVVPDGVTWTLPAYELALLTAARLPVARVTLVTHEPRPLHAFGSAVSVAVTRILGTAGVTVHHGVPADVVTAGELRVGGRWLHADRMVALPRPYGHRLRGVPADDAGFVHVDARCRVVGLDDVFAAGDATTLAIKQGGLAAQQAGIVADEVLARLGGTPAPAPRPAVLRGVLSTADGPRYLRAEVADPEGTSAISDQPLWWPPTKVASRWLAPHLLQLDEPVTAGVSA